MAIYVSLHAKSMHLNILYLVQFQVYEYTLGVGKP